MTEQKPVAWLYEQEDRHGDWYPRSCTWRPGEAANLRNIRPLYLHPAPPAEQKPVAWSYSWAFGEVLTRHDPTARAAKDCLRDVRPLYEHPAPSQPATDPAIEAARRKALREILAALAEFAWDDDCAGVVRVGVLRDLVGQPRKDPERRIPGYDEEPKKPTASGEQRLPGAIGYDANGPVPVWRSHVFESQLPEKGPEQPLKVSATMRETRVNTAGLAQKEAIDFIAEGLEAAHAARTHTDAMWWLMTDGGKEKWRAEARVLVARAAKAI